MKPKRVESRGDLLAFISEIIRDHDTNGSQWENRDLRSFLDAMRAWLEDCDGYYLNTNRQRDVEVADWQIFADALAAARTYE